jgi:hypothetical protein
MDSSGAAVGIPGDLSQPPPPPASEVEPDAFTVRYQLTSADIRSAGLATARYSVMSSAMGAFAMFTGGIAFAMTGDLFSLVVGLVGILWISGLLPGLLTAFIAGRRPEIMQQPTTMTVSPAGIRTVTALMSGESAWATYKRLRPTRTTLLFELGTGAAVMVPTRFFESAQLDRLLAWADVAGVLDRTSPVGMYAKGIVIGALVALSIPAATWLGLTLGLIS